VKPVVHSPVPLPRLHAQSLQTNSPDNINPILPIINYSPPSAHTTTRPLQTPAPNNTCPIHPSTHHHTSNVYRNPPPLPALRPHTLPPLGLLQRHHPLGPPTRDGPSMSAIQTKVQRHTGHDGVFGVSARARDDNGEFGGDVAGRRREGRRVVGETQTGIFTVIRVAVYLQLLSPSTIAIHEIMRSHPALTKASFRTSHAASRT